MIRSIPCLLIFFCAAVVAVAQSADLKLDSLKKDYDAKSQKIRDTFDAKINGGSLIGKATAEKIEAFTKLTASHTASIVKLSKQHADNAELAAAVKKEKEWAESILADVKAHKDKKKKRGNDIESVAPTRPGNSAGAGAGVRSWTNATNGNAFDGQFVKLTDGRVYVKKSDGRTINIGLNKLSKADREYVKGLQSAPRKGK